MMTAVALGALMGILGAVSAVYFTRHKLSTQALLALVTVCLAVVIPIAVWAVVHPR